MPTVLLINGYRFFFYSNDHLPIHIHIEKGDYVAKFNINPLELVYSNGFRATDLKIIRNIIMDNVDLIESKWNEHFNN